MTRTQVLIVAGAGLGGFLWWRSRQQEAGAAPGGYDPYAGLLPDYSGYGGQASPVLYRMPVPVSGPTPAPAQGPLVSIPSIGPSFGRISGQLGTSAGTAIGIAALGPGTIATAGITAGISAGVALLSWAIISKGLFRGGEVGVVINPMRDHYIGLWGPSGTGPGSGFFNLAAELSQITGEGNGSHYFLDLIHAEEKDELIRATQAIQYVYAGIGVTVPAYTD